MKALSCAAARRRLQAFHDDELAVADQIAVSAHLEACHACAAELAELTGVRTALHNLVPGRLALSHEEAAVFNTTLMSRLTAENDASFIAYVREVFDDMHLVYAGFGAAAATMVCVVIMLGMMRFATDGRPDSLAAIVSVVSTPLECETGNDPAKAPSCRSRGEERWAERFQRANESAEQDAIFTLESVIMHQGRLANLELLRATRHRSSVEQVKQIEGLLELVSRSRLDSAQLPQAPAPSNMLWLVERATVRANKTPPLDVPLPPKKRAESITLSRKTARA